MSEESRRGDMYYMSPEDAPPVFRQQYSYTVIANILLRLVIAWLDLGCFEVKLLYAREALRQKHISAYRYI